MKLHLGRWCFLVFKRSSRSQMGIGSIPDAVLAQLGKHKDLGVHSEMFSDGVVDLMETGAITNNNKVIHQGKLVSSFTIGTNKLFNWMHNNPSLLMLDVSFTNNPQVRSRCLLPSSLPRRGFLLPFKRI